jgi:hypothetical protein
MTPEIRRLLDEWRDAAVRAERDDWCNTGDRLIWRSIHQHRAKVFRQAADELEAALLALPADRPPPEAQKESDA